MLSRRTAFDLTPNRFGRMLERKRERGERVIDLTVSNPTRCGFSEPGPTALAALADPEGAHYDPSPRGRLSARAAIAAYYADRGSPIDAERIVLAASTSEAYAWLFKLLCDDGDDVLAPVPSYPLFDFLARLEGVTLRPYRLHYDGAWSFDPDEIEGALGPRTRAILLVSPNNPTGSVASARELSALDAIAARHDVAVVCDEVFADFVAAGTAAPVAAAGSPHALTFTLSGLSKVCGLPQLKLGWMAVGGGAPLVEAALSRVELIADTYLSVSTPVQLAAAPLLENRHGFIVEAGARIRRNRARLVTAIRDVSSVELLKSDGGWCACLRLPRTRSEEELVLELLDDHGVAVQPGYFFDFAEEAYVVVSLIVPEADFEEGIDRLLSL